MKIKQGLLAIMAAAIAPASYAGSISPDTFSTTMQVGESITIQKTVTTDDYSAVSYADIFFLSDNTGSMGDMISSMKLLSSRLTTQLQSSIGDVAFGVGSYFGDPDEYSGADLVRARQAYDLDQAVTTDTNDVQRAIASWTASGGGDEAEANFFALQQLATSGERTDSGVGTGEETGWRDGAERIAVWMGDAYSHTETIGLAETIDALQDENVTVIALNTGSDNTGLDRNNQASAIVAATDGVLVNDVDASSTSAVLRAIIDSITTTTASIDLTLRLLDPQNALGLDIQFECASAEGCDDVGAGESRLFNMIITALTPGQYDFSVIAPGIADALALNSITVVAEAAVPVPAGLPLFTTGIVLLGIAGRVRRKG